MDFFLSDQHIHCIRSIDSETPMDEMARAALSHGVPHLCFTDHIDIDDALTGLTDPVCLGLWEDTVETYRRTRELVPEVSLCLGMELGEPHHRPEWAETIASAPECDLILGSLHNLRGVKDFYYLSYESAEQCAELNRRYVEELLELAEMDCFDIMSHIGYTRRYMRRAGFYQATVDVDTFGDELRTLLRRLIERGKGIELNCSGLRDGSGAFPTMSVLELYRELGGEIITVGSDAHTADSAGVGIAEGYALLREAGFRYVALFRKRKPEFQKL